MPVSVAHSTDRAKTNLQPGCERLQPTTSIVSLVAWGGVGKSVLVQNWLQRLERTQWLNVERVFAWSFFSQGTQEDRQASEYQFLTRALAWFGVPCDPATSPWDKGGLLADAVRQQRTLLILDGVEPLQYPPGPMGGQLRAPGVQSLLLQLARDAGQANGLCIVTTREPLNDLNRYQRRTGLVGGSVLRVDLGNLNSDAGAIVLHQLGVTRSGAIEIGPASPELLRASEEVGGHALTLKLLGRFLFRGQGGDIQRRDLIRFEEADRTQQGGTTFRMLAAFEGWFSQGNLYGNLQVAILKILGLFDRPAGAADIAVLRTPPAIAGVTDPCFRISPRLWGLMKKYDPLPEEDWNTALSFLRDFGLVQHLVDARQQLYALDCHPLVREYFGSRLCKQASEGWQSAHLRLSQALIDRVPESESPSSDELEVLYQAVGHGCLAGQAERTMENVYQRRVLQWDRHYSLRRLGMFGSDLKALASFFDRPWSQVASGLSPDVQSFLFSC